MTHVAPLLAALLLCSPLAAPAVDGQSARAEPGAAGCAAVCAGPSQPRVADIATVPAPLTLSDAISRARARSPRREGAAALAEGARVAARVAGDGPNPAFEVRVENWRGGARDRADLPRDAFAVVTQPIELGGKRGARRALASADVGIAEAALLGTEHDLAWLVAQTYVDAFSARTALEALTDQQDGVRSLVDVMRRRVHEGYAAESDLRKFEAELARVETDLLRIGLALDRGTRLLSALLGDTEAVGPDRLVRPEIPALAAPARTEADDPALDARSDVRSARAALERAGRALALERAAAVPDLAVSAGYKRTAGLDTGVAAVNVVIPVFDRNRPAVARALAQERAASRELDAVRLHARADARAAVHAAAVLAERAGDVQTRLVAPAEVVRAAARAAFHEGGGDVLRLVDAERALTDARRTASDLALDAVLAAVRARLALGEEPWP